MCERCAWCGCPLDDTWEVVLRAKWGATEVHKHEAIFCDKSELLEFSKLIPTRDKEGFLESVEPKNWRMYGTDTNLW